MKRLNYDIFIRNKLSMLLNGERFNNDGNALRDAIDRIVPISDFRHIGNYQFEVTIKKNKHKFWISTYPTDTEGNQIQVEDIT